MPILNGTCAFGIETALNNIVLQLQLKPYGGGGGIIVSQRSRVNTQWNMCIRNRNSIKQPGAGL